MPETTPETPQPLEPEDAVAILESYARRLRAAHGLTDDPDEMARFLDRVAATIDDLRKKLDALQRPKG